MMILAKRIKKTRNYTANLATPLRAFRAAKFSTGIYFSAILRFSEFFATQKLYLCKVQVPHHLLFLSVKNFRKSSPLSSFD